MTTMNTIKYTTKINSTDSDVKIVSCDKYEELCKNIGCYEVIPDDENVKLYFDIDYKQPSDLDAQDYDDTLFGEILTRAFEVINKFCIEHYNQSNPRYTICQSNSSTIWKISIHIIVENVIATKKTQRIIVDELNNYAKKFTDVNDYMPGLELFDTSVYSCKRKMRSLWCSKVGENRPLILHSGSFEGHCISSFIPEDAVVYHVEPEVIPYVTPLVVNETDSDNEYLKWEEYIDCGLFSETCKEGTHNDYCIVGYALINVLGKEKAKLLFHKLTMNYGSDNKKDEFEKRFDALCLDHGKNEKCGRTTLMNYAKKVNADKVKEINKKYVKLNKLSTLLNDGDVIVTDDDEASDIIISRLKDVLVFDKDRLWIKQNNVWKNDDDFIHNFLIEFIMKSKLFKNNKDGEILPFVQNIKNAKGVKEAVISKIKIQRYTSIYTKFHTTTIGRLCFLDGVLDFPKQRFYTWEQIDFEYYTCVQINMTFNDYIVNPDRKVMKKIMDSIMIPLFNDKTDMALHFLSRAIAGFIQDKNYATYVGNRDCGKGVIYALCEGFGDYMKSLVIENAMCSKKEPKSAEISRMLYWTLDYEFVRLGISQETPEPDKGLRINGTLWKKIVSGGDELTARRNYDRKDTKFNIQMTPFIFGNNSLEYTEEDCREKEICFESINQFKTQEYIDLMRANGEDERVLSNYKVADENLKSYCKTEEYRKAFILLVFESFKNTKVNVHHDINDDDRPKNITQNILDTYDITGSCVDMILVNDLHEKLSKLDKKKVVMELKRLGVDKKRYKGGGEFRDKWVYVGIKLLE
jgi:hypothetical protein